MARKLTGLRARHARNCSAPKGGNCSCRPTWEASVFSRREGKKIRKTFATLGEAKSWRANATIALRKGTLRTPTRRTLRQAADEWLDGAKAGTITKRNGQPYKPSVLRGYEQALRDRVLPDLGGARLSEIRRVDLQDFADRRADDLGASTIRNTIAPFRVIYRRAVARGEVAVNPTTGLELPAVEGCRERIAFPEEGAQLLDALRPEDRALWAMALYAGLRRGELMALRWENFDLAQGVIRVEQSYDPKEGVFVSPKSRAGRRSVPIPAVLRDSLVEHKLRTGRGEGLVFGTSAEHPFTASNVWRRAHTAWRRAGLEPITLHEARHTFASLMIAARVNAKALSSYMGHSSITITYDRYGHLMPGNEEAAAGLLDAYLAHADTAARLAQVAAP
jgi:integrase